jgi:hypothetical protein
MQLDINGFLAEHYSEEELDRIFVPPKPKMESLLDLMEKVRREKQGDD